jgi:thioredoxin-like negative regulator of GroEL
MDNLGDKGLVAAQTPGTVTPSLHAARRFADTFSFPEGRQNRGGMGHQLPVASTKPMATEPAPDKSGPPPNGGASVTTKNGEETNAYLKMNPTAVIVLVMNGCGFCTKIKQELPKLNTKHPITLVDAKDMGSLPKDLHTQGFPTLHLFKNGKKVKTHPGYMPAAKLDAMIAETLD